MPPRTRVCHRIRYVLESREDSMKTITITKGIWWCSAEVSRLTDARRNQPIRRPLDFHLKIFFKQQQQTAGQRMASSSSEKWLYHDLFDQQQSAGWREALAKCDPSYLVLSRQEKASSVNTSTCTSIGTSDPSYLVLSRQEKARGVNTSTKHKLCALSTHPTNTSKH